LISDVKYIARHIVGREPVLIALEAGQTTIPSSIFYEVDGAVLIGR
jgi:hypothetical chaperone protein